MRQQAFITGIKKTANHTIEYTIRSELSTYLTFYWDVLYIVYV